jgi:hypothetical protein
MAYLDKIHANKRQHFDDDRASSALSKQDCLYIL